MPRSPRRRIRLASVAAGLMADRSGWIGVATGSLAPATGVGTTRFCRTHQRRSSCVLCPLTDQIRPAITSHAQRCRVHRIPPRVRDDRDPPLVTGETRGVKSLICPTVRAEYFCAPVWTARIALNGLANFDPASRPRITVNDLTMPDFCQKRPFPGGRLSALSGHRRRAVSLLSGMQHHGLFGKARIARPSAKVVKSSSRRNIARSLRLRRADRDHIRVLVPSLVVLRRAAPRAHCSLRKRRWPAEKSA